MKASLKIGLITSVLFFASVAAQPDELGDITFPNSGAEAAQEAFLTGVKALHSFQFAEAGVAFRDAQESDPDFALAYWGEALSNNMPLWGRQDINAATAALKKLAPNAEARQALAPTEKEKAWLNAAEILFYSSDDKLERDTAYSQYLAGMHERWPDDDEIAVFYSVSLLGTVRPGDRGFRRQAQAASVALDVFDRNPNHPGAAHFIIHSFDDPEHAILALPAAEVYASIAPAAAHALHMPSHIFLQLGMWEGVANSNIDAYAAAVAANERFGLEEGREDFHTLSWLAYANLMLGYSDRAEEDLAKARAAVERNPGVAHIYDGYLGMLGRHILETQDWRELELADADSPEGRHADWVSVVGINAAHRGDTATAEAAFTRLRSLAESAAAAGNQYNSRKNAILASEVNAVRLLAEGDTHAAVSAAREAAEMELEYMSAPSGPPSPMKPASELYAETLLAAGRAEEAVAAFEQSLAWVPQRTPSLLGLAQAAAATGDLQRANELYDQIRTMPGVNRKLSDNL